MPIPTETMPSLRADIAETLDSLAMTMLGTDADSRGLLIWSGADTLRWVDERERTFDEAEREDLAEQLEDLETEYESDRAEWDAKRDELEQTIARLREDLAYCDAD